MCFINLKKYVSKLGQALRQNYKILFQINLHSTMKTFGI